MRLDPKRPGLALVLAAMLCGAAVSADAAVRVGGGGSGGSSPAPPPPTPPAPTPPPAASGSLGIEGYDGYTSVINDLSSTIPGGPLNLQVSGFPYSASASLTLGADPSEVVTSQSGYKGSVEPDAYFTYYFTVNGPSGATVPVDVTAALSATATGPSSASAEADAEATLYLADQGVAVPEPATWALMLVGLGGLGLALRRANRRPYETERRVWRPKARPARSADRDVRHTARQGMARPETPRV